MAAIAGFIDVISFIGLNGLFTAHITGNIVIAIAQIIHKRSGILPKIVALPLFMLLAVLISWTIARRDITTRLLRIYLRLEALCLAAFMVFSAYIIPHVSVNSWSYLFVCMLPVTAMAIHNTLSRIYMNALPPVTVMTGNLSQFMVDLTAYCCHARPAVGEKRAVASAGIKRYGNILLGFLLGGLIAALSYVWLGFWLVSLTVIVLLILARQAQST